MSPELLQIIQETGGTLSIFYRDDAWFATFLGEETITAKHQPTVLSALAVIVAKYQGRMPK